MSHPIFVEPLTARAFAPFGDVLACTGDPDKMINRGMCGRYHNRAALDFADGQAGISIFDAKPRTLPLVLDMVERHPEGSQAFLPMHGAPFLIVVAADQAGHPAKPRAFLTDGTQGVNYHRGTWHGVLTPLALPGRFAVVDRIGAGENLEEHWFETPFEVRKAR